MMGVGCNEKCHESERKKARKPSRKKGASKNTTDTAHASSKDICDNGNWFLPLLE